MNFFQSIEALKVAGDWKINITKDGTGKTIVSVLFYNEAVGDAAAKKVPPILLKGTPQELDEGFVAAIGQPVQETAALFTNMEQYLNERAAAKQQSAMEKDKTTKTEKQKAGKQEKYEEAMKKVDELEAEGRHRDAWMKVPDPQQYQEYAGQIKDRKTALAKEFAPDLFNEPAKTV